MLVAVILLVSCEDQIMYEKTRLFRPVLNQELKSIDNTILVNMAKMKDAQGYTLEVSRDTFKTIDYTFKVDTNYVVINEELTKGDPLFWNTVYQIRATVHAQDLQFDSKPSDLGSVRTQRFPSIQKIPNSGDVTDKAARVIWTPNGVLINKIKIFAASDLKLTKPLSEVDISSAEGATGVAIIKNLDPATAYQLAIYSDTRLRGWEVFKTLEAGPDLTTANVIDLTNNQDPDAVVNAIDGAVDGAVIVIKKGFTYNLPSTALSKSLTIRGSIDFGTEKAVLFTSGNWNFASGANIGHVRFVDLEVRGNDIGANYVFNPNNSSTTNIDELSFDNCIINNFRGIIRIRGSVFVKNFTINNSIVHHIGNYGICTTDTDGDGKAAFDNLNFTNSTFSKINMFITSRQNMESIKIDACTFNEFSASNGIFLRFRGTAGVRSNVVKGISFTNSIFGTAWDEAQSGVSVISGINAGLEATSFTVTNTWGTSDFGFVAGSEIAGFPSLKYGGKASDLWVSGFEGLNFNIKDNGFAGKYASGDPRWRAKL